MRVVWRTQSTHFSRPALSSMVAISHVWPFKFKLINGKFSSSITLATFPMLNGCMWLVATILDNTYKEYFYHHRNFYRMLLLCILKYLAIVNHQKVTHIYTILFVPPPPYTLCYGNALDLY